MSEQPFWQTKRLTEMTAEEWELLCDGCGKCCLNKLEDEGTGEVFYTNVACKLLDLNSCRCKDYSHRRQKVPDCLDLRATSFHQFHWLPASCAYRLLAEGKALPAWHPLLTGCSNSVHRAGVSVRSYGVSETGVEDLSAHVIEWLKD